MAHARQLVLAAVLGLLPGLTGCGNDEVVIPTVAEPIEDVQHSSAASEQDSSR